MTQQINISWVVYILFIAFQEEAKPELKEQLDEVGFIYYLILARLEDLKPRKPDGKLSSDISEILRKISIDLWELSFPVNHKSPKREREKKLS